MLEKLKLVIRQMKTKLGLLFLSPLARRVVRDRLTYLSPKKLSRIERTLARLEDRDVPGDMLEFGVALGGTAILIAERAVRSTPPRRFHGFDVFAMIPPPNAERDDEKSLKRYEQILSGRSQGIGDDDYYGYRENLYDDVHASFARHGRPVDNDLVQLHKGLFEETWPVVGAQVGQIAFAHVDCDWYDPVAYCLDSIADLTSPGGAIVIDDYHDYPGARDAVDAFLRVRPDFMMEAGRNPVLWKRSAA